MRHVNSLSNVRVLVKIPPFPGVVVYVHSNTALSSVRSCSRCSFVPFSFRVPRSCVTVRVRSVRVRCSRSFVRSFRGGGEREAAREPRRQRPRRSALAAARCRARRHGVRRVVPLGVVGGRRGVIVVRPRRSGWHRRAECCSATRRGVDTSGPAIWRERSGG